MGRKVHGERNLSMPYSSVETSVLFQELVKSTEGSGTGPTRVRVAGPSGTRVI